MRVLHISTNYKPLRRDIGHGGVERLVLDLVVGQRVAGLDAHVLSVEGTSIDSFPAAFPGDIQAIKSRDRAAYDSICARVFEAAMRAIIADHFDVVHDHMGAFATWPGLSELPARTGLVVSCYGQVSHPHYREIYADIPLLVEAHPYAILTCCSEAHRDHFRSLFVADHVVHHAVAAPPSALNRRGAFDLCMANVIPEKAHDILVDVPPLTGYPMVFAGPLTPGHGERSDFFESFMQRAPRVDATIKDIDAWERGDFRDVPGVSRHHRCWYVGEVCDEAMRESLFRSARRLVLCNRTVEPFSLVVLEALVRGLAVAAGPFASAREVDVPGVAYIEQVSTTDIANALLAPAPYPEDIAGAAAARFSITNWVHRWNSIYAEAIARRRAAG